MLEFNPINITGFSDESEDIQNKIKELEKELERHFFVYAKMEEKLEELYPLRQDQSRAPRIFWS